MSQWVLNNNGKVLPYQTFQQLAKAEIANHMEVERRDYFDKRIKSLLVTSINLPPSETLEMTPYYEDDNNPPRQMSDANSFKEYDKYHSTEVLKYFCHKMANTCKMQELSLGLLNQQEIQEKRVIATICLTRGYTTSFPLRCNKTILG